MAVAKVSKSDEPGRKTLVGNASEFALQMTNLINNKKHSDVKFVIGEGRKTIHAHRCILSGRCPVFHAMFTEAPNTDDKEVQLVMSDMCPDVFLALLEFIYTNCVTLSPAIAVGVLALSIEYGLDDLRKVCTDYLCESVTEENVCNILQSGVIYRQSKLIKSAVEYIEDHTKDVFNCKNFHELSEEAVINILKSSKLQMDEMDILAAVKNWAAVNSVVLGKTVAETAKTMLTYVRFYLFSTDELSSIEEVNSTDKFIPIHCISEAWKFHALKQMEKSLECSGVRAGTKLRDSHEYLQKQ